MAEIAGLAQELEAFMWVVSHLATPEGKSHEEGGRVMARHLKGARAISHWAHYIIGLERNQQSDDEEERRTSIVRVLKDRFTGRANGFTFAAKYDFASGMLTEAQAAVFNEEPDGSDF
jgi:twinkle protein